MGQEAFVPAVDASGEGVGAKAAEANKRTAQMAKTPPALGAPSAAPAVPAPASATPPAVPESTQTARVKVITPTARKLAATVSREKISVLLWINEERSRTAASKCPAELPDAT